MSFTDLLSDLFEQLEKANSPLLKLLNNGIDRNSIVTQISKFNVDFPEEVFDLFSWKNGVDYKRNGGLTIGEAELFLLGSFLPFEYELGEYIDCVDENFWEPSFFPIFASGGGDYFLMDCNRKSERHGSIYFFSPTNHDFEGILTIFDSLKTLMESIVECFKTKAFYYDLQNDNYLCISFNLYRSIFKKNNPESQYWKIGDELV